MIIVAQNDWMAIGARRAGIAHDPSWSRVPVVGCDGLVGHGQALPADARLASRFFPGENQLERVCTEWSRAAGGDAP